MQLERKREKMLNKLQPIKSVSVIDQQTTSFDKHQVTVTCIAVLQAEVFVVCCRFNWSV
jgi:hypothetical protein